MRKETIVVAMCLYSPYLIPICEDKLEWIIKSTTYLFIFAINEKSKEKERGYFHPRPDLYYT